MGAESRIDSADDVVAIAAPALARPAWAARVSAAALVAFALIIIGYAQWTVLEGSAPFHWPLLGSLDDYLQDSFYPDRGITKLEAPVALSFALPLFAIGGLLFAMRAPALRHDEAAPAPRGRVDVRRGAIAVAAAGALALWLALVALLAADRYEPYYRWIFVGAFVLALGAMLALDARGGRLPRPRLRPMHALEALAVLALCGTFIGINVRDLDSWRYAAGGDDGAFFGMAQFLRGNSGVNWFSQSEGVYNYHPVLSSVWQMWNLQFFGDGLFGWKMASLLAVALTLPPFYWLLRQLFGPRAALYGTLALAASHYLFAYAHTGYNNIFALFPTVMSLALLVAGLRHRSLALLFLCGAFAGLGWYSFYSARATIGIVAVPVALMGRREWRLDTAVGIGAGFAMVALPLFATDGWSVIDEMLNQSAAEDDGSLASRLVDNAARAYLPFLFNPNNQHHTAGALLDGVTAVLALAGIAYAVRYVREPGPRLILIWFFIAATVTGLMVQHQGVAISRWHYAIPPLAALAGLALDRAVTAAAGAVARPRADAVLGIGVLAALAPALFIINGRQFFIYAAERDPTSVESVILRELTSDRCRDARMRDIVYSETPDSVLNVRWRFFGMDSARPLQIAFRDVTLSYGAYPASGGIGCLAIADPRRSEALAVTARAEQGSFGGANEFHIVTDLARFHEVAFTPPVERPVALTSTFMARSFTTDFSGSAEVLTEIVIAQAKDGLPPIDAPQMVAPDSVDLHPFDPVVAVRGNDTVRVYPVRYLIYHGVVNDTLDGAPIVITYDPVAGSAVVYRRDGAPAGSAFGTTGLIRGGNALLYDRATQSFWQQLTGEAIAGTLTGSRLGVVPSAVVPWQVAELQAKRPLIMQRPGAPDDRYDRNPYLGYDSPDGKPIFNLAEPDPRLKAMQRVAVVGDGHDRVAVALPPADGGSTASTLDIGGLRVALLFDARVLSMLDTRGAPDSRSVGTVAAYAAVSGERALDLHADAGSNFFDQRGQTAWNLLGTRLGASAEAALEPVPLTVAFWHSVAAAYPGIEVVDPWGGGPAAR